MSDFCGADLNIQHNATHIRRHDQNQSRLY